ncbi:MAG TPA: CmcJ/NvfI family oxidoreductase, partial [Xanthobacteraceae bacterium]|nr:CmcJ/NvfI family oxidoreductase [Xanthobacteraceae bacterium]
MSEVLERPAAPETIPQIEATLNYLIDTGEKIITEAGPGGTADTRGGKPDPHRVVLRNGRPFAKDFVLEREGFRFVRHDTKVADFFDDEEVRRTYYPEMEALVKAESGAKRVVIFDHTLRTADDGLREERKIREVVPRVHNDYTEWSAPQRVRDLLPDEAEALLKRRFAV